MESIVYKVVETISLADGTSRMQSACQNRFVLADYQKLEYKIGEWIRPVIDKSLIFCFGHLGNAKSFAWQILSPNKMFNVFKCTSTDIETINVVCRDRIHIDNFWKDYKGNIILGMAPSGTLGVKAIKLDEEICYWKGMNEYQVNLNPNF